LAREEWKKSCYKFISKAKPVRLRPVMTEIFSNMLSKDDGEFACMGTFTPGWVSHLGELRIPDQDLRGVKKFLRHAVFGARCLMREYARIREVSEGDARPLRQTSIMQYVVEEVPADKLIKGKKSAPVLEKGSSPPIDIWASSAGGWGRVIWKGGNVCAPPCIPPSQVRLRQQHLRDCGLGVLTPQTPRVEVTVRMVGALERGEDSSEIMVKGTGDGNAIESVVVTRKELAQEPVPCGRKSERRKLGASSRMRTLFSDPRLGDSSIAYTHGTVTCLQPRSGSVSHDPLAIGGAYRP